jgi:methylglutaconyl-CoA hydratase
VFSITEVRWGLHASIIVPHLNDAISVRQTRRYALSGERFGAEEARRIGLVHEVVPLDDLAVRGEKIVATLLENSPEGMAKTKAHILEHAESGFDTATFDALIQSHSDQRQTVQAAEGLASFAEKRSANWAKR